MRDIVFEPHPTLREVAQPVLPEAIKTPEIQAIIADMKAALAKERHGVAIAAPQIGVSLRIFIVAGHVYALKEQVDFDPSKHLDQVFINPEVMTISQKKALMHEGCLSVKSENGHMMWGEVRRSEKAKIRAFDETGELRTVGASGLLAQIFQHEIDHLNGVLYTDVAQSLFEEDEEARHE